MGQLGFKAPDGSLGMRYSQPTHKVLWTRQNAVDGSRRMVKIQPVPLHQHSGPVYGASCTWSLTPPYNGRTNSITIFAFRPIVSAFASPLEQQPQHHGYDRRLRPPVFRYLAKSGPPLTAAHAVFDLAHHLVFATRNRVGVFDSAVGKSLTEYWLKVAAKRGFAIGQVSIVPDHIHLIVRIAPKLSIEECALALLNHGQYFAGRDFPHRLVQAGIPQLWPPSGYAGTCGQITTALIKAFLSRE